MGRLIVQHTSTTITCSQSFILHSVYKYFFLSITDWHVYDIHLRIQYNHSLYHWTFNTMRCDESPSEKSAKKKTKRRQKGLKVSNFTVLVVVFKWHHGSEGVNQHPGLTRKWLAQCAIFSPVTDPVTDRVTDPRVCTSPRLRWQWNGDSKARSGSNIALQNWEVSLDTRLDRQRCWTMAWGRVRNWNFLSKHYTYA